MATLDVEPAPMEHGGHIVPLLSIKIDGVNVSSEFPPFDASASSIGTSTCLECFVATGGDITFCGSLPDDGFDSHDVIGIRRHNGKIVWFHQHDAWSCPIISGAEKHHMWLFDIAEYESKLGGDSSNLPGFNATDIQRVIRLSNIPDPNNAIYRIPSSNDDRNGKQLMTLLHELATDDGLLIIEMPNDVIPYEIGFERNCNPDVLLDVGTVGDNYAFRLNRNPAFPFWITSETINQRFPKIAG